MRRMFGFVWAFCVILSFAIIFIFTVQTGLFGSDQNPTRQPDLNFLEIPIRSGYSARNVGKNGERSGNDAVLQNSITHKPIQLFQRGAGFIFNNEYNARNISPLSSGRNSNAAIKFDKESQNPVLQDNGEAFRNGMKDPAAGETFKRDSAENSFNKAPGYLNYDKNPNSGQIVNPGYLYSQEKSTNLGQLLNSQKITLEQYYRTARTDKLTPLKWNLNPHPFNYITNCPSVCEKQNEKDNVNVFLLVMVPTSITNYAKRNMIRQTWGKASNYAVKIRVVFLLGKPELDPGDFLQGAIFEEQSLYRDLVQEEYFDTYTNLTYKTLSGLKWIVRYCSNARYMLKVDDHVFVNMPRLIEELLGMSYHPSYIIGNVRYEDEVHRVGRWSVDYYEWPMYFYPVFVVGPAYIISVPLAIRLFNLSHHVPFFRLEDVYTTGFVGLLATSPAPNYVQWDARYHITEMDFVESFTGSMYGRYLFSHVDNTDAYPSVWKWIERHKLHKLLPESGSNNGEGVRLYPLIPKDKSAFGSTYDQRSDRGGLPTSNIAGGQPSRTFDRSTASENKTSSGDRLTKEDVNLAEERHRILVAWKAEKENKLREKYLHASLAPDYKDSVKKKEEQTNKESDVPQSLIGAALNAAFWLKRRQNDQNSKPSTTAVPTTAVPTRAPIYSNIDESHKSERVQSEADNKIGAPFNEVQYERSKLQSSEIQGSELPTTGEQGKEVQRQEMQGTEVPKIKLQRIELQREEVQRSPMQRNDEQKTEIQRVEIPKTEMQKAEVLEREKIMHRDIDSSRNILSPLKTSGTSSNLEADSVITSKYYNPGESSLNSTKRSRTFSEVDSDVSRKHYNSSRTGFNPILKNSRTAQNLDSGATDVHSANRTSNYVPNRFSENSSTNISRLFTFSNSSYSPYKRKRFSSNPKQLESSERTLSGASNISYIYKSNSPRKTMSHNYRNATKVENIAQDLNLTELSSKYTTTLNSSRVQTDVQSNSGNNSVGVRITTNYNRDGFIADLRAELLKRYSDAASSDKTVSENVRKASHNSSIALPERLRTNQERASERDKNTRHTELEIKQNLDGPASADTVAQNSLSTRDKSRDSLSFARVPNVNGEHENVNRDVKLFRQTENKEPNAAQEAEIRAREYSALNSNTVYNHTATNTELTSPKSKTDRMLKNQIVDSDDKTIKEVNALSQSALFSRKNRTAG